MPTFPKPSVNHELFPKADGPVNGVPSPACSQHWFGVKPAVKSSNYGGSNAPQGVVKLNGPAHILDSPGEQTA